MRKLRVVWRVATLTASVALAAGASAWRLAPEGEYKFACGNLHRLVLRFGRGQGGKSTCMNVCVSLCRRCLHRIDHVPGCDWRLQDDAFPGDVLLSVSAFPAHSNPVNWKGATIFPTLNRFSSVPVLATRLSDLRFSRSRDWSNVEIGAPQWLAMGTLLSPMALWTGFALRRRGRRRNRETDGHCLTCDYDLSGLPEPRCPECGTAFDAETFRAANRR